MEQPKRVIRRRGESAGHHKLAQTQTRQRTGVWLTRAKNGDKITLDLGPAGMIEIAVVKVTNDKDLNLAIKTPTGTLISKEKGVKGAARPRHNTRPSQPYQRHHGVNRQHRDKHADHGHTARRRDLNDRAR